MLKLLYFPDLFIYFKIYRYFLLHHFLNCLTQFLSPLHGQTILLIFQKHISKSPHQKVVWVCQLWDIIVGLAMLESSFSGIKMVRRRSQSHVGQLLNLLIVFFWQVRLYLLYCSVNKTHHWQNKKNDFVLRNYLRTLNQIKRILALQNLSIYAPICHNQSFKPASLDPVFRRWTNGVLFSIEDFYINNSFASFARLQTKFNLPPGHFLDRQTLIHIDKLPVQHDF